MDIAVRFSRRRTMAIKVDNDTACVTVYAPIGTPEYLIERFVGEHQDWIQKTKAKVQQNAQKLSFFQVEDGGYVLFLGEKAEVCFAKGIKKALLDGGKLYLPSDKPEEAYEEFLRKSIKPIVSEMMERYSKIMNVCPKSITITGAKTRWGSCSGKNAISFSFRLCMAPMGVIEYVVVHELAHIIHKNHSASFYVCVKRYYGDYVGAIKWLRQNAGLMDKI